MVHLDLRHADRQDISHRPEELALPPIDAVRTTPLVRLLKGTVYAISLVASAAVPIYAAAEVFTATRGPAYCREMVRTAGFMKPGAWVESGTVWTRTLEDHWVSAIVYVPADLSSDGIAVVCHFRGKDYVSDHVQPLEPANLPRLREVARSNLDPRTWF